MARYARTQTHKLLLPDQLLTMIQEAGLGDDDDDRKNREVREQRQIFAVSTARITLHDPPNMWLPVVALIPG